MINVSEIIREWEADGEWRVSPGVGWCAAGNRVIIGDGVTIGNRVSIGNRVIIGDCVRIGNRVSIGNRVRIVDLVSIGKFVIVGDGVKIGNYVSIGKFVSIGKDVIVGNYVSIGKDVSLADGVSIGDGVTIGNYVSIGKDVKIGNYVSIGDGIRISDGTSISDGACISAEPHTYNRDGCTSVPVGAVAWMVSGGGYQPTLHFSQESAAEAVSDSDSVAPFGMSDDELAKVMPLYLERDALAAKVRELEADAARALEKLLTASEELKKDLLMRAEKDEDGCLVVDASHGRWEAFKEAIDEARLLLRGEG